MKFINVVVCAAMAMVAAMPAAGKEKLVILHTNDTHSHIDPVEATGRGGVMRRKALIDSVRAKEPNVLLIDAGDIVQGTLYFHLYKGEVEQKMLNELGYDIQIMGNHEFDNGVEALAAMYSNARPLVLSTNYDVSGTPLAPYVSPYAIKEYGGKRIGIFAINLDPKGMIADANAEGIKLLDWKTAANATAWHLKHNEKVDAVIAVTHIGYTREPDDKTFVDRDLAAASSDIDIIVGGHSHTRIDPSDPRSPAWRVANADGDSILVVQTGRYGEYLGEIDLDLDDMTADYRLIPVDSRLDGRVDSRLDSIIAPYRHGVDSLYSRKVARVARDLSNSSPGLLNFATDFILERGRQLASGVDMAIGNKGGLRRSLLKGDVTEGMIIDMMPFTNRVTVLDLKGSDLAEALDVMALRGGDGVSQGVEVIFDPETHKCISVMINGQPLDPQRTYRVATIDYLANGGDYMTPLKRGSKIAQSDTVVFNDLLTYLASKKMKGKQIDPPVKARMKAAGAR